MRRALASFLLALFSLPLIAPLVLAGSDSTLPACCRREGKHRCSMTADDSSTPGEVSLHSVAARCASYPKGTAATTDNNVGVSENSAAIFAAIVSHPAVQAQAEARYRISFARSSQKRGPPALLS
jgi:hypothetical protein